MTKAGPFAATDVADGGYIATGAMEEQFFFRIDSLTLSLSHRNRSVRVRVPKADSPTPHVCLMIIIIKCPNEITTLKRKWNSKKIGEETTTNS
jgi:hypothetical protein